VELRLEQTRLRDAGFWMLDAGYWILDAGYWILDAGFSKQS